MTLSESPDQAEETLTCRAVQLGVAIQGDDQVAIARFCDAPVEWVRSCCAHPSLSHDEDQELDLDGRPLGRPYPVCWDCVEEDVPSVHEMEEMLHHVDRSLDTQHEARQ